MHIPFTHKTDAMPKDVGARPVPKVSLTHALSSDPFLDWVIIIVFAIVVCFTLVSIAVYVYLGTGQTLEVSKNITQTKALSLPLDEKTLTSVLVEYNKRAEEKSALQKGYSAPQDPSLP